MHAQIVKFSAKAKKPGAKAIVIDALPEYRLLLKTVLTTRLGLDVLVAATCEEAATILRTNTDEIQYVVSDVVADRNGKTLTEILAQHSQTRAKLVVFSENDAQKNGEGMKIIVKTELRNLLQALKA